MSAALGVPRAAAIYLGVVQFLFATTWTLYVIYFPALAENAGIEKHWVPWILVADQVIIAAMDVITGFWAALGSLPSIAPIRSRTEFVALSMSTSSENLSRIRV